MILSKSVKHAFNPDEFRRNLLEKESLGTLLSIVPTRRRIRNLSRYFIQKSSAAIDSLHIETIETAAEKLLRSTDIKFSLLNDAVSVIILRECFEENKEQLKYFPHDNIPSGTLDKLKNLISEYKRHPISVNDLIKEIEDGLYNEGDILKVQDIILIYDSYNRKCETLRLKETGDLFLSLNQITYKTFIPLFRKTFENVSTIIVEGYNQFSNSEIAFIDSLSKACEVFIDFDYFEGNENVFGHIDVIKKDLINRGWQILKSDEKVPELQNYLGHNFSKYVKEKKDFSGNITVVESPTRDKEVEIISKQIKKIINENKCDSHRIGVLFNDISKYSDLIRDKFFSSNIPFNLTDRKLLSSSIPVSALFYFLQISLNDFYYKDIMRAFSNGFITLFKKNGRVNSGNLLQCASMLKITGGLSNWEIQIKNALKDEENYEHDLNKLKWALEDIRSIKSILEPFQKDLSPAEFLAELKKIITKLQIVENIKNSKYNKEENARGFQKLLTVLDDLFVLQPDEISEEKFPLSHYVSILSAALNRERFSLAERPNYGVFISNLDEARGLKFDYLFIGGLVDGELPTPYKPELFVLRKKDEEKISKSEIQQIRERYLFYQTICSFRERVYLSYPSFEEKRQFERSVFLREMENVLLTGALNEENFRNVITSKEELLRNFNVIEIDEISEELVPAEKLNENIAVEKLREYDISGESRFNGYLIPEEESLPHIKKDNQEVIDNIISNLAADRTYSISQFENYASCPFRYFSERMLKLKSVEDPNDEIEKTELGSLLHEILCSFYLKFGLEKAVTKENFKKAEKIIFEIAEELAEDRFKTEKDFYEKEKIFGINGNREDSILYRFLINESEDDSGFLPWKVEHKFDNYVLNAVKIKGQIDRIDINRKTKLFRVIDYKLGGKTPTKDELAKGLSLQLPVYLEIAGKEIEKELNETYSPQSGIIYSLKVSDKFGEMKKPVKDEKDAEFYIELSITKIKEYADSIAKGRFNMSGINNNGACTYCDFKNICRAV